MPSHWDSDQELFALVETELFSAVVGDVMDQVGLLHQFLPPSIRPLRSDMQLVGRAMTALVADIPCDAPATADDQPFGLMFKALDSLQPHEVYLCGGGCPKYALWGELMSTRAKILGAAGAVVDGYYRDSTGIEALHFPTFGYGAYAQDQGARGRVVDYRTRIEIGQVSIETGDIVVGDRDGVCIVPRSREEEVFTLALEKARAEKTVRRSIEAGMPSAEAFAKYGVM